MGFPAVAIQKKSRPAPVFTGTGLFCCSNDCPASDELHEVLLFSIYLELTSRRGVN